MFVHVHVRMCVCVCVNLVQYNLLPSLNCYKLSVSQSTGDGDDNDDSINTSDTSLCILPKVFLLVLIHRK